MLFGSVSGLKLHWWSHASAAALFHYAVYQKNNKKKAFQKLRNVYQIRKLSWKFRIVLVRKRRKKREEGVIWLRPLLAFELVRRKRRTNMVDDTEARFSCSSGCVTLLFSVCPTMETNAQACFMLTVVKTMRSNSTVGYL